jgi:hypothetical protein
MKQLQRLLFLQGNVCFFCHEAIPKGDESIEHLYALANGGHKDEENCVVCCKSLNAALGSSSVKQKFRAILSHRSGFTCPRRRLEDPSAAHPEECSPLQLAERLLPEAIANIQKRGATRPAKLVALRNALTASLPDATPAAIEILLQKLQTHGHVAVEGSKVIYPKFKSGT